MFCQYSVSKFISGEEKKVINFVLDLILLWVLSELVGW